MPYQLRWDDLRLVLAIGREGTLLGAAGALRVDHSTVHRRLGQIEQRLGARLFERHRTGLTPTPAGEAAIATARRIEEDVVSLESRLAGEDLRPSGTVRISTSDTILLTVLTPLFATLRARWPEIVVEVTTTARSVNLSRREADLAIRVTNAPPPHLVGRQVGEIRMPVYGAREKIGDAAGDDDPDPRCYDWVGFDDALAHIPPARWMAAHVPAERLVFRADTSHAMADAVRAGIGVAPLPHVLGDRDPALRRLEPSPMPDDARGLWLLTHPHLARVARIRAIMEHLAAGLPPALVTTPARPPHTPAGENRCTSAR
ncbi:MAG TPA: LysR family transcriptional regulator [Pseudomonadales bacterium]